MQMVSGTTFSQWPKIWYSKMTIPDFLPNGSPNRSDLPFADPTELPRARQGLPKGITPLPGGGLPSEPPPRRAPIDLTKPARSPRRPVDMKKRGFKKPIDLSKPRKVNEPRKSPGRKIKIGWLDVIEYILEDNPSSDGTLPDYEFDPDPDEPYPDENSEPGLEENECVDSIKYPELLGNKGDSLVQITYYRKPGHIQNGFQTLPSPSEVIIARKTYLQSIALSFNSGNNGYLREVQEIGRETRNRNEPGASRRYKLQIREGSRRTGDGKFVWGGYSVYWTAFFSLERFPSMPAIDVLFADSANISLTYQGTRYSDRFPRFAFPCPEDEDREPEDPNDYDREEDEENMACKWKPANDISVESLELQEYEYQTFSGCYTENDVPLPAFSTDRMNMPKCVGETLVNMLNRLARLEGESCSVGGSSYWDVKKGDQTTLFAGIPNISGVEVALPLGCVNFGITFDNAEAKQDTTLRDLKRIGSVNATEQTFIHTMRVWIIDSRGNAVSEESLWVPSTLLTIPFQFRNEICKVRMMPKSVAVTFTVFDSGDRWERKMT